MAVILDGKAVSAKVKEEVKEEVEALKKQGVSVGLAVIIVGNNPASRTYVNNKKKACEAAGIVSEEYALPEETTQEELLALVEELNRKDSINGILCQLPLPKHLDEEAVIAAISDKKDVDAFSAVNVGHIMIGDYSFLPCTPAGIMEILRHYNIDVAGKECVVIGRSNIVGNAAVAPKRHGDDLSLQNQKLKRRHFARRCFGRGGRDSAFCHRGHGQRRRGRH